MFWLDLNATNDSSSIFCMLQDSPHFTKKWWECKSKFKAQAVEIENEGKNLTVIKSLGHMVNMNIKSHMAVSKQNILTFMMSTVITKHSKISKSISAAPNA